MANSKLYKGSLNTIILKLLEERGKMYGYEISQLTKERTNHNLLLTEGAIYPALHRLEKDGLIISSKEKVNGRTRKYYSVNVSSLPEIDSQIHLLSQFTGHLQALLNLTL